MKAHADLAWASDLSDRKHVSGNLFQLRNNAINWTSRKQTCTASSSAEAEYVAAASAAQEIYLTRLLTGLDLNQEFPITIYEDNQSCIKLAMSEKHHNSSKHIDI